MGECVRACARVCACVRARVCVLGGGELGLRRGGLLVNFSSRRLVDSYLLTNTRSV